MRPQLTALPIDPFIPQIIAGLRNHSSLVLVAQPGAGKTTRVPPAIIHAHLLPPEAPKLVMLQPRRVAARAIAGRIAQENLWKIGDQVGYQMRLERNIQPHTPLRVLTEGVLTRQLLTDPFLEGIGLVVLDEFHERSVHLDLALAMLRQVQQMVRPELRLVVMSATMEAEPVAAFLGGCPILQVPGQTFPVKITHEPAADLPLETHLTRVLAQTLEYFDSAPLADRIEVADDPGDVLVFLPGVGEIERGIKTLSRLATHRNLRLLPLHGSLTMEDQMRALEPSPQRKIILATNIAETSLTIEGVRTVIDSGWVRRAGYDAARGMDRLERVRISRASARQRAGRAGRTAPGTCVRLWSVQEDRGLAEFDPPEIQRLDLGPTVLHLYAWDKRGPENFPWFEPPSPAALAAAQTHLQMLGAVATAPGEGLTPLGKRLARLPIHPRLGRMLLEAAPQGLLAQASLLCALISEKDILIGQRTAGSGGAANPAAESDLLRRMEIFAQARPRGSTGAGPALGVNPAALANVERVYEDILQLVRRTLDTPPSRKPNKPTDPEERDQAIMKLLLATYPDRVCRRRKGDHQRAVMVGGKGVRLGAGSAVLHPEFFLAIDLQEDSKPGRGEGLVTMASGIERAWLADMFPQAVVEKSVVQWDSAAQRVVALRRVTYQDMVLEEVPAGLPDPAAAAALLADVVAPQIGALIAAEPGAAQLLGRIAFLRRAMPELALPEMTATTLREILVGACSGQRSLAELQRESWRSRIWNFLDYAAHKALDQHAPEALTVPSGRSIRLEYASEAPPILAVRLQEMLGCPATPRIAGGRVAVLLHLLGPNYRPVQITNDLASFWKEAYFMVRKDLRARYPKHSWPDDPLVTAATPMGKPSGKRR